MALDLSKLTDQPVCPHDVIGICPQCDPRQASSLASRKLSMAIAWLEQIACGVGERPGCPTAAEIAKHALEAVADLKR